MNSTAKKKLFLHIGSHKTGTTHLQGVLAKNKAALAKMSIIYPRAGRIYGAHFELCWSLRAPAMKHHDLTDIPNWAALIEEIQESDAAMAIVSAEEFGLFVDPARLAPLNDFFDVTIVSYLRSPDSYMESFYNQFVKDIETRETRTINTYIVESPLHFLYTRRILEPWLEVFGTKAIKLRLFEEAVTSPGGLTGDFFSVIGITHLPDLNSPNKSIIHKVSLPPDALEYLRLANPSLTRDSQGHYAFVLKLADISHNHKALLSSTSAGILSFAARKNLRARFAGQNAWAARTFLNRQKTPFPPADTPPPPSDFDSRPIEADAKVLGTVAGLLRDLL